LKSSPISSLEGKDNAWIASSMLSRISQISDNIVVIEKEYPVGIIGGREIIKGIQKNPTVSFFSETTSKKIMNRKFYLDSRKVTLQKILEQMHQTNRMYSIIQNSKYDFSAVSVNEILEIGSLCQTEITAADPTDKKIITCKRDDSIENITKLLSDEQTEFLMLENESGILDQLSFVEKITNDLNFLKDVNSFLELNASIFQFYTPKLIPEKLPFSEICKVMLEIKHPYVMTTKRLWTPQDVLDILMQGEV
jgi:predicted transcriptional regulator